MLLTPGDVVLGDYVVESYVSRRGGQELYRAHQREANQPVDVRIHLADWLTEEGSRFRRAAQRLSLVYHEHVARIVAHGIVGDWPCVVCERLEGETLRQRLERVGALPWQVACELTYGVLAGLSAYHSAGLIHRNIKPDGIMVTPGDPERAVLVGLAFAKPAEGDDMAITCPGTSPGSPAYMAPEQMCTGGADVRTDIYGAGLVLHEMLTGVLPERPMSPPEILRRCLEPVLPPIAPENQPPFGRALQSVVTAALSSDPSGRPKSPDEMERALRGAAAMTPHEPPVRAIDPAETDPYAPPYVLPGGSSHRVKAGRISTQVRAWRAFASRYQTVKETKKPPPDTDTRIRGLLLTKLPVEELERPEILHWLALQARPKGRGLQYLDQFWAAIVVSDDDNKTSVKLEAIGDAIDGRFAGRARVATRLVGEGFRLSWGSLNGRMPLPREFAELLEVLGSDEASRQI